MLSRALRMGFRVTPSELDVRNVGPKDKLVLKLSWSQGHGVPMKFLRKVLQKGEFVSRLA